MTLCLGLLSATSSANASAPSFRIESGVSPPSTAGTEILGIFSAVLRSNSATRTICEERRVVWLRRDASEAGRALSANMVFISLREGNRKKGRC